MRPRAVADGVDQDCDSQELCWSDGDGDTYGSTGTATSSDLVCTDAGEADNDFDCDDGNAAINPAATEGIADGVDQDCDSQELCWNDGDGDTYGSTGTVASSDLVCTDAGEADNDQDCNDGDAAIFPGAAEGVADGVDQDCDNTELCWSDGDGDTYGSTGTVASADLVCTDAGESVNGQDCDDGNAAINPAATEIPGDMIDQDCDTQELCYVDMDGDTYGTTTTLASVDLDCSGGGESPNDQDCDDMDSGVNPAATEIPGDGIDQNCDGQDNAVCFEDLDGDGFGSTNTIVSTDGDCTDPGESDLGTDCDDGDNAINPSAMEIADDGIDQDCNGADTITCFVDADQDTFGSTGTTLADDGSCDAGQMESANDQDCDDADATVFPGAMETLDDGIDQDCNGADAITCFVDADQDAFGSTTTTPAADGSCDTAQMESGNDQDCDDADAGINPNATEGIADGVDHDCDGLELCYLDGDGDSYGSAGTIASPNLVCTDAGEADNDT